MKTSPGRYKHKCLVPTCPNHNDAGIGMLIDANNPDTNESVFGFICGPCWKTILGEGDKHSWLYKSCNGFKDD